MDPYLEQRWIWPDVHTALIVAIRDYLAAQLRPRYRVAIDLRVYTELEFVGPNPNDLVGRPDAWITETQRGGEVSVPTSVIPGPTPLVAELPMPDEIKERYLEVREVATNDVVTVIELLSPSNKRPGVGRREYEAKRMQVLGSLTHLVEIDIIRSGTPFPMRLREGTPGDYRIVVSRAGKRPRADVYAFILRDPIPDFPVPLLKGDPEPRVPLNRLLHDLYDRAGYDLAIDYGQPLDPPLLPEEAAWAAERVTAR
jgi:hypothetical protein